jgi:hypothetical protein
MEYWKTFTTTIKQWWNHKYLWIVGILGSLLAGSSTGSSYSSSSNSSTRNQTTYQSGLDSVNTYLKDPAHVTMILIVIAVIVVVGLVLFALSLYLQARADSALYQATKEIAKEDKKLGFWKTWSMGKLRLGTLVKQKLLIASPFMILALILLVASVIMLLSRSGIPNAEAFLAVAMLCLVLFLCVSLVYAVLASIASLFGRRIIVLENVGALAGLRMGFDFFIKNFLHVVMFWIISWISSFVVTVVTFVLVFGVLIFAIGMVVALFIVSPILGVLVGIVLLLIFVAIISLISGPVYAFTQMYWTNVYLEIKRYNGLNG